ncbi:hypothetical protein M0R04_07050 [Candidatus Dojkabacteria bacterium]|jgi:hypothetical protein|nr:hypothetical protein [Candidatus Dojkabacteria bacterium]
MHQTFKQFLVETTKLETLAKKLGVEISTLDKMKKEDIKTILKYVGKHDYAPNSDFNTKQLTMGIKIEKEHTDNELVAELIAKDHLKEFPKYYTSLTKMEKEEQIKANQNRERDDSDFQ